MTTENINITQPVEIKSDATARVAFDLMDLVSRREKGVDQQKETRTYWLTLYGQCYKAARGDALQYVLEQK